MPKKFKEEDIQLVWRAVDSEKLRVKQVCAMLNCTPAEVDKLYKAALRRHRYKVVGKEPEPKKLVRPKAEYSNATFNF